MPYELWDDEYTIDLAINKMGNYAVVTKNNKDGRPWFCTHIGKNEHVEYHDNQQIPQRRDFPDKINIRLHDI